MSDYFVFLKKVKLFILLWSRLIILKGINVRDYRVLNAYVFFQKQVSEDIRRV
jgi:hypothetical protein